MYKFANEQWSIFLLFINNLKRRQYANHDRYCRSITVSLFRLSCILEQIRAPVLRFTKLLTIVNEFQIIAHCRRARRHLLDAASTSSPAPCLHIETHPLRSCGMWNFRQFSDRNTAENARFVFPDCSRTR